MFDDWEKQNREWEKKISRRGSKSIFKSRNLFMKDKKLKRKKILNK